jgi:hypothetical protein
MHTAVEIIELLVGVPPEGFEYLSYLAGICLSIFVIRSVIGLFGLVLKSINNK